MARQLSLPELAEALLACESFAICGHVSPDGDCLGSELALAHALRSLGKQVVCLLAKGDPLDHVLRQLPGMDQAVVAKDYPGSVEAFVTVDVPSAERMGSEAAALHARARLTFTIDHHIPAEPLSQMNYVDAESPATALIVWELIPLLGVQPSRDMASCCYVGLMTDTGRFQYQNTTAQALAAAGAMVAAGADPAALAKLVYQNRSRASLALEERMLAHREFPFDGRLALSYLNAADFEQAGATRADAEDLVDVLRSVRGVRVACLMREQEGVVRGSLRAKDDTDVAAVAREIGGGGHKAAAGFTFEGSMDAARDTVRDAFRALFGD